MFTGVVMAGTQYLYGATRYGVANCPVSGMDSLSRLFKPYMQFDGAADGKIYRNWDLASNYRIDRDVTQIDRSASVLRP
jgi:hypothetical protein